MLGLGEKGTKLVEKVESSTEFDDNEKTLLLAGLKCLETAKEALYKDAYENFKATP